MPGSILMFFVSRASRSKFSRDLFFVTRRDIRWISWIAEPTAPIEFVADPVDVWESHDEDWSDPIGLDPGRPGPLISGDCDFSNSDFCNSD